MRILQISPFFPPSLEAGGVARMCYEISKGLAERGHDVTVYSSNRALYDTHVQTNKPVSKDGVRVYYFENLRRFMHYSSFPPIPYFLPVIARREIESYEIVHIHDFRNLFSVLGFHYASKKGIPYVLQCHGSVLPFFEKARMKRLFDLTYGNRILNGASRIIAVSRLEEQQYQLMGVDKGRIDIVPNFVDVARLSESKNLALVKEQYGIARTRKLVLYLGRLHRAKRIDLVIRAFNMLVPEMDDVVLVLAGPDAGHRKDILNLVQELGLEEKVMVVEHVDDVAGLYSIADVLVYPAKTEIFGLVPFEALACGTPVIVSSGSGCSELISEVDCGVVVNCDDALQFKNAIKNSLCNPDTARASANKGREYVLKYLNRDRIINRIEEIYERCIA